MRTVSILDYDLNNLRSLARAVEVCGAEARIVSHPSELDETSHLIVPGVGNFTKAMALLDQRGWPKVLGKLVDEGQTRILGICLGMQLLAEQGTEGGETPGLGLISGRIERLQAQTASERIPHVGWNEVEIRHASPIMTGIPDRTDFYFVHSYHFVPRDPEAVVGTTAYCGNLAVAIQKGNVFGVQFHPEKSSQLGLRLLRNFIEGNATQ